MSRYNQEYHHLQLQKQIEDLLNFSIAHSHTTALVRKRVALAPVIKEVLADHKIAMLSSL